MNFILITTLLLLPLFAPTLINAEITCPNGSFQRTDENGNIICLDNTKRFPVEPIVTPDEIQITDEQSGYIIIGVIIFIIIIAIIVKASQKTTPKSEPLVRRGWTEIEKEQVRIRQDGKCQKCGRPPPRWEYHHRNGNRSDNSLSNCEGLCPNCHSVKTHD